VAGVDAVDGVVDERVRGRIAGRHHRGIERQQRGEELPVVADDDGLAGDYTYGPPEQRNPSRVTTMFQVTPGGPFGLKSLKYNFTSPAAQAFEFPTGN